LAELAELTGQLHVLCADPGDPQSGNPVHGEADCSGVCCHLGHGLVLFVPIPPASAAMALGRSVALRQPQAILAHSGAHWPSAKPRGPPLSV
jgi:hypothetical protein